MRPEPFTAVASILMPTPVGNLNLQPKSQSPKLKSGFTTFRFILTPRSSNEKATASRLMLKELPTPSCRVPQSFFRLPMSMPRFCSWSLPNFRLLQS